MKKLKLCLALLLSMALILGLTGCASYDNFKAAFFGEEDSEDVIYFGIFEPLSGVDAEAAKDEIAGIELAHEQIGHASYGSGSNIRTARVDLIYADNKSEVEGAREAAQMLVDNGAVFALGSFKSVLSMAGGDIFNENHLPAIGITCKNPLVTQTNEYYYRVCYIDSYEGNSAAHYVVDALKDDKVAVFMRQGDDYAQTIADQFSSTMVSLTGAEDSVQTVSYPEGIENYMPYLISLELTGCETVFYPEGAAEAAKVIKFAKENEFEFNWIGTSSWKDITAADSEYGNDGNYYLDGISYLVDYDTDISENTTARSFLAAYKAKYGEDAVPSENFALGYDAYLLAIRAIQQAESFTDSYRLSRALTSIYKMDGVTGTLTLNSIGDPIKEVAVEQLKGTELKQVYIVTPSWGE